ncbi:CamS family sex pheromone protein, partial [Bacillus sp. SS-TM]
KREDLARVSNFKAKLSDYFQGDYTAVIGTGMYRDDELREMKLDIPVQFNGKAEIVGFTQYVAGLVMEYFPNYMKVQVTIKSGEEAIHIIETQPIDLVILDIMMPKMDGYEVTRQIRTKHHMPIIFLSAKTSDFDKVTGLVLGADDYMTKPFTPIELVARVNAQLRRFFTLKQPKVAESKSALELGGVVINPERRTVDVYGEQIELTPKEFDILYLLASHPKKVYNV